MVRRSTIIALGVALGWLAGMVQAQTAAPTPAIGQVLGQGVALLGLPDALAPVLTVLNDTEPLKLVGRNADGTWFYALTASTREGWLPYTVIASRAQVAAIPLRPISVDEVLNGTLFYGFGQRAYQQWQASIAAGRNPAWFTRVGDSISVEYAFLRPFGYGTYDLGVYANLLPTLEAYNAYPRGSSPFVVVGDAARVGWTTRNLLTESFTCTGGLNRVRCALEQDNASIALVLIGTNDSVLLTVDEYQRNLALVLDTIQAASVLPILSTLPSMRGNEAQVAAFNRLIVATALERGLPLINLWLGMQGLAGQGLSEDGIHPSSPPDNLGTTQFVAPYLGYGYTVRNLLTLQALHAVRNPSGP